MSKTFTPKHMTAEEVSIFNSAPISKGVFGGQYASQRFNVLAPRLRRLEYFAIDFGIADNGLFMLVQSIVDLAHAKGRVEQLRAADRICGYLRILEAYEALHEDTLAKMDADPEGTAAKIAERKAQRRLLDIKRKIDSGEIAI